MLTSFITQQGVLTEAHFSPDQVRGKRTQLYLKEKGHQLLGDFVCSLGPFTGPRETRFHGILKQT